MIEAGGRSSVNQISGHENTFTSEWDGKIGLKT
jgi:hypothetical protein